MVEERRPEIEAAMLKPGRPGLVDNVALLSSVGCPYTCDFCVDWNNRYVVIPKDQLWADLRDISENMPGVLVSYHNPNSGVRFEQILDAIEDIRQKARNPYLAESSLSILRDSRLPRLRDSNCVYIAAGIESWGNYSNQSGVGVKTGAEKLTRVISHFQKLHRFFPGLQGNFIFGTDVDEGDEPVDLTKEFLHRLPFVWPSINIPIPFGGTPLYDHYLAQGRILRSMPFSLYYMPQLVTTLKHYHPLQHYAKLIDICTTAASNRMLARRFQGTSKAPISSARKRTLQLVHLLRTLELKQDLGILHRIHKKLQTDAQFRAFHEGRSDRFPDYYRRQHLWTWGSLAELFSESEMVPDLGLPPTPASATTPAVVHLDD